jgi:hypothetical protein
LLHFAKFGKIGTMNYVRTPRLENMALSQMTLKKTGRIAIGRMIVTQKCQIAKWYIMFLFFGTSTHPTYQVPNVTDGVDFKQCVYPF